MEDRKIIISTGSLFKILAFSIGAYIVWLVWEILLLVFVAMILAALIDPFASWLQERKIPRALAVVTIYLVLFGLIGSTVAILAPVIANDVPQLIENIQETWVVLQDSDQLQRMVEGAAQVRESLEWFVAGEGATVAGTDVGNTLSQGLFTTISGVFAGVVSLILILVITFYLVVQDDPMKKIVVSIMPKEYVPYTVNLLSRMRDKLAQWVRGQLILSISIGVLVFLGLTALGIKYAAALALIAALLEFVPYVGPTLAAIPGVFLAFTQGGPVTMLLVLGMYVIIQWAENNILVPKIMQKAVGLNPVVSIVAILTGVKLAGVLGALLAIPVATAVSVFLHDIIEFKQT